MSEDGFQVVLFPWNVWATRKLYGIFSPIMPSIDLLETEIVTPIEYNSIQV